MHLLIKQQIPKNKIFIFVSDEDECAEYLINLTKLYPEWDTVSQYSKNDDDKSKIVVGKPGICNQRKFINSFFPLHHHVVSMDDDVSDVKVLCSSGHIKSAKDRVCSLAVNELHQIIEDAGVRMLQSGAHIWSVSLSQLAFHLQHQGISTNFGVCVGYFFGVINRKIDFLDCKFGACGDDVERSLRYAKMDGLVLRYRMLYCDTKFREGQGGINAEIKNRRQKEIEAVAEMTRAWPDMIKLDENVKFKSGLPMKILRNNFPRNQTLQTSINVPGIIWVPPAQRQTEHLPKEYLDILLIHRPTLSFRQSHFAKIDEAVRLGKLKR